MTDPRAAWAVAFTAAQAEFPEIPKTKTAKIPTKSGGSFSYSYADLADIVRAVRPILNSHGLSYGQPVGGSLDEIAVTTRIYHVGGHVEEFGPLVLASGNDARAAGSSVTYARRYALTAALGIVTDEDDDAGLAPARQQRRKDSPEGAERGASQPAPSSPPGPAGDLSPEEVFEIALAEHVCPECLMRDARREPVQDNNEEVDRIKKQKGPKAKTRPRWSCPRFKGDYEVVCPNRGNYSWGSYHATWEGAVSEWLEAQVSPQPEREGAAPADELPEDELRRMEAPFA